MKAIDLDFDPIFIMQSTLCMSQTHKVYKHDGKYLVVVDVNQSSGLERIEIGRFEQLSDALDCMSAQFKIDEESNIESIQEGYYD